MSLNRLSIGKILGTAIVAASLSVASVQAKPAEAAKTDGVAQNFVSAKSPYFFLVLGVGY